MSNEISTLTCPSNRQYHISIVELLDCYCSEHIDKMYIVRQTVSNQLRLLLLSSLAAHHAIVTQQLQSSICTTFIHQQGKAWSHQTHHTGWSVCRSTKTFHHYWYFMKIRAPESSIRALRLVFMRFDSLQSQHHNMNQYIVSFGCRNFEGRKNSWHMHGINKCVLTVNSG